MIDRMSYEHPVYTTDVGGRARPAARAQRRRRSPSPAHTTVGASTRTAAASGVEAAAVAGCALVNRRSTTSRSATCGPIRCVTSVRHRSHLWFVDLDDLPQLPRGLRWLARFESRDHLGDPTRTLRANLDDYLAEHGIDLHGGRITMLANAAQPRLRLQPAVAVLVSRRDGAVVCVVAEVHNTYGQRHRYLLRPDDGGRAEAAKEFYVSPFYPVDGYYRMSVPGARRQLAVTITLHRPDGAPFVAIGARVAARPAGRTPALATALRHPFETWRRPRPDHRSRHSPVA